MTQPAMSKSYAKMIVDAQLSVDAMRRFNISPNMTTSTYIAVRMGMCSLPPEWADRELAEAKRVIAEGEQKERT